MCVRKYSIKEFGIHKFSTSCFFGSFLFAKNYLYFLQVIMRNNVRASSFSYFKGLRVCKNHLHINWILQRVHRGKRLFGFGFFKKTFFPSIDYKKIFC